MSGLRVLVCVRCLACGEVYSKPLTGSIAETNPGCPACRYVGWILLKAPGRRTAMRRPAEGRLQHRSARSR
jgi:hypothetical protein